MLKFTLFLFFSLSLILTFCPQRLSAETSFGFSYLGICHKDWPCKESFKAYDNFHVLMLSFLYDESFGSDCPCIRKFYEDTREKIVRIHLTNGPGLRNKRLQQNEVFYGQTVSSAEKSILQNDQNIYKRFSAVAKRAQKDLSSQRGSLKLFVSPCLECDFSKETRMILFSWTKEYFPQAQLVDNPLNDSCINGFTCEKHSKDAIFTDQCIFDTDGFDSRKLSFNAFDDISKNCIARFAWIPQFNLNQSLNMKFIPPQDRSADVFEVPSQFFLTETQHASK